MLRPSTFSDRVPASVRIAAHDRPFTSTPVARAGPAASPPSSSSSDDKKTRWFSSSPWSKLTQYPYATVDVADCKST